MSKISSKRLASVYNRYRKKHGLENGQIIDDIELIHFFKNDVLPNLVYASLSSYRSDLKQVFSDEVALKELASLQARPRKGRNKRTSSLRKKSLSKEDLRKLKSYAFSQFEKSPLFSAGMTSVVWLRAGLLSGLRPNEWQNAKLDHNGRLIVKNIKLNATTKKEWRPRIIPLDHLSDKDLGILKDWLELFQELVTNESDYQKLARSCSQWLYKANKKIFPRRKLLIGLMSARHQFMANLKASKLYTPTEIAYLVGHANDLRAFESYSSSKNGNINSILPSIPPEAAMEMSKISQKLYAKIAKKNPFQVFEY